MSTLYALVNEDTTEGEAMKELLVRTGNRDALDRTLQTFGALIASDPEPDGTYAVRTFPPNDRKLDFVKFAITNQGYAEVVAEREIGPNAQTGTRDVNDAADALRLAREILG